MSIYTQKYMYMNVYKYIHIHKCNHMYTHKFIHIRMYLHTYIVFRKVSSPRLDCVLKGFSLGDNPLETTKNNSYTYICIHI